MSFITIYITHANADAARQLSKVLLEERLIACVNLFPIQSSYWWKNEIDQADEWVSLVKTRTELWLVLLARVEALHPYDTPCIMKSEVEANPAYEKWITDSVIAPESL